MKMADYPQWVLKHKTKGTYINCVNGKYYLYAAHSERVPGTKKVKRVSDGYIGRITEKDGLIPARDKVAGDIIVLKYGLHMTALALADEILMGLRREFRGAAERMLVMGILLATEKNADGDSFNASALRLAFPGVAYTPNLTGKQRTGVERCTRMVADKLSGAIGDNTRMHAMLERIYMVIINNKQYLSQMPAGVGEWMKIHGIEWRGTI